MLFIWQMEDYEDLELYRSHIINKLQDIIEIIIQDIMNNGYEYVSKSMLAAIHNTLFSAF